MREKKVFKELLLLLQSPGGSAASSQSVGTGNKKLQGTCLRDKLLRPPDNSKSEQSCLLRIRVISNCVVNNQIFQRILFPRRRKKNPDKDLYENPEFHGYKNVLFNFLLCCTVYCTITSSCHCYARGLAETGGTDGIWTIGLVRHQKELGLTGSCNTGGSEGKEGLLSAK